MLNLYSPTKDNTFVVIVTFNPDGRLLESIIALNQIFKYIIVVDNGSSLNIKEFINNDRITIIKNEVNYGIGKALNIGADYSLLMGAKWILMLDQDTIPISDLLLIYSSIYFSFPKKELIGQIGLSYNEKKNKGLEYFVVTTLITSGSLLSLDAYKVTGSFRDDFFIDSVDFEYSLRLCKNGFVNLLSSEIAINHRLGNLKVKKYFFLTVRSTNHPPLRRYYMARNHVILTFQYILIFPIWIIKKNYFFFKSILEILLVDDQKILKIKKTFSGLKDGILFKTNRI
jgi:rhamnosyltransferase